MLIGKTAFLPELVLTLYDNLEFFLRILLAGVLGGVIGLERTRRQKDAGIRTHCIIAVSSAAFMILSKYAFVDLAAGAALGLREADPARIAAQVVTGISFLGAGVIFKNEKSENASVKGLTTAAGIWGTSAIGMAIGAGLYWLGLTVSFALVLIQWIFHRFPVGNDFFTEQDLSVRMKNDPALLQEFTGIIEQHGGEILRSDMEKQGEELLWELTIKTPCPINFDEASAFMQAHEQVTQISV